MSCSVCREEKLKPAGGALDAHPSISLFLCRQLVSLRSTMMYDDVTICMMTVGVMAKLLPKVPAPWPDPGGIYFVGLRDVRCHLFAHVSHHHT